jgi:hypothetical protein
LSSVKMREASDEGWPKRSFVRARLRYEVASERLVLLRFVSPPENTSRRALSEARVSSPALICEMKVGVSPI